MNRADVTIFEGPDGAGKTTLIKTFEAVDPGGTVVEHLGPHEGDPLEELVRRLAWWPTHPHVRHVLFDRFHLGEQVYGPIYRGVDRLGENGRREIESLLRAYKAIVVVALPPYAVCQDNWAERKAAGGEMFPDPTKHRKVWDAYESALKTDLPTLTYDYTLTSHSRMRALVNELRAEVYR